MALNYELDQGFGGVAKLGLIVLSTDESLENEARQVLSGRDVSLVHTRIQAEPDVTPKALKMMEKRIPSTAELLPKGLRAVGYGCTSASTVIGTERVEELVHLHHPDAAVTNPMSAVIAALNALNAKDIAFVTPYVKEVNAPMRALLQDEGFNAVSEGAFEQSDDKTVARISEESTLAAIENIAKTTRCDAVFVSCTNLRTFGVIEAAEEALNIPIVSSNQALIWHMLKLSGGDARGWGPGMLFAQ